MRDARAGGKKKGEEEKKGNFRVRPRLAGSNGSCDSTGFHGPRRAAGSFASPRIYGG